ncbi:unnamed protein product [Ectocarpus sp. 6 AP-2014]
MKLSPVASLYSMGAVLMSACCKYHLVDGLRRSKMTMSYRYVKQGKEYWRLGSSVLLYDLENPLDMYTLAALFMCLLALEQKFFKGSPSAMASTLVFIAAALFTPGFYFRELRLKEPAVMMYVAIATWATIRCFFRPTAGVGSQAMFSALGPLIPIATPHFRKGEIDMALLKHQAMAVAVGLACVLLIPDAEGARALRQKRQQEASRKARASAKGKKKKNAPPVPDTSSSSEEEEEEEADSSSDEE